MNRDELLQAAGINLDLYVPGDEQMEGGAEGIHVRAHADVYWTRALIYPTTVPDGEKIVTAGTVIPVALIANVIVDPDHRGEGWGRALVTDTHRMIQDKGGIPYAVTFGCLEFFHRWSYERLPGAVQDNLLVAPLFTNAYPPWPTGRFEIARGMRPA